MRDRLAELQKKLPKERSLDVHLKLGVILVGFWRLLG